MNILVIESPAVSKFGNQRIYGGFGSYKSESHKPPLDMMWIAGYIRKCGFKVHLLDANASKLTYEDVKQFIIDKKIGYVVFSTSTCTISQDVNVARVAKEVNADIITAAVGINVMAFPEELLNKHKYLGVAVYSREWEYVSMKVAEHANDLRNVKGIIFRSKNGEVIKNPPQPDLQNLDELGFPAHDLIDKKLYRDVMQRRYPKTMIMGARGCVGNCTFCCQPAFWGNTNKRSVEHILEELRWVQELGFKEVMFNDATLTSDRRWASQIFEGMIANGIDLGWHCSTRAERLDEEILRLMKMAGCHAIAIGMESANKEILKNIRKGVTTEMIKEKVSLIRKHGIDALVFCVLGFPGETKESIKETINFVKKLDTTYITLGIAAPYPNTGFYEYLKSNDYLLTDDWSQFDPAGKPVFSYPDLSSEELHYYAMYGLRVFYLRPKYIINRILSIRNLDDLKKHIVQFKGFVKRYILPYKRKEI